MKEHDWENWVFPHAQIFLQERLAILGYFKIKATYRLFRNVHLIVFKHSIWTFLTRWKLSGFHTLQQGKREFESAVLSQYEISFLLSTSSIRVESVGTEMREETRAYCCIILFYPIVVPLMSAIY